MSKKKTIMTVIGLVSLVSLPIQMQLLAQQHLLNGTALPFYIYRAYHSPENHYAPSGWMGDYGDLAFDDHFKDHSAGARPCIKVVYSAKGKQGAGWAGIYWQHPANNWGNREGGYNLNGADRLIFLARGDRGGEKIAEFKVGGIEGNFRDSGAAAIGPLELTKKWQEYVIPLDGQELSNIAGGFCLTMSSVDNPKGATVYLDNIRFE